MFRTFWVLIADASRARIVEHVAGGDAWQTVDSIHPEPPARSAELGRDYPGRSFESAGEARHAIEPKHDPAKLQRRGFVDDLARHLDRACLDRRFDHLALVAPSRMLGELRAALSDQTRAMVRVERAKDLTKIPDAEIASHLEPILDDARRSAAAPVH